LHNEFELSGNSISISGLEIRRKKKTNKRFSSSAQVLHTTEKHVISRRVKKTITAVKCTKMKDVAGRWFRLKRFMIKF